MSRAKHLDTRDGPLCGTPGIVLRVTPRLTDVNCLRCESRYINARRHAADYASERARERRVEYAATVTGLTDLWRFVSERPDDASNRAARGIVATVVLWAYESGMHVTPQSPAPLTPAGHSSPGGARASEGCGSTGTT